MPSWTDDGHAIFFDYGGNVYVVDANATEVREWIPPDAPSPGEMVALDYSPDVKASKVAFTTLRYAGVNNNKDYEIATANLDGSDYRRLTDEDGLDLAPAWSPDGSKIAFTSNRAGYASREDSLGRWDFNVYIMDADGSDVQVVGPGFFIAAPGVIHSPYRQPVWSPDGAWLAFRGSRSLYTVHTESFRTVNLGLTNADPAWSPDGEWIALVHMEPDFEGMGTIYVARPDGSEARKVFQFDPQDLFYPGALNLSWSADGLSLRFSFRPGDADRSNIYFLHEVGVDESEPRKVSEVPFASRIVWSPDGSRAVISRIGPGTDEGVLLYTTASDGSDKRVLVRHGLYGPYAAHGE